MTNKSYKPYFIRIIIIIVGITITQLGKSALYSTYLGNVPMSTFIDGASKIGGITYGQANFFLNLLFLIVMFFLDRKLIHVGTILMTLMSGGLIDLFNKIFSVNGLSGSSDIRIRVLFTILGSVLSGIGIGLYTYSDLGYGPFDGVMFYLVNNFNYDVSKVKIIQDAILCVLGIVMGGSYGVGTIIAILLGGPSLKIGTKIMFKIFPMDKTG